LRTPLFLHCSSSSYAFSSPAVLSCRVERRPPPFFFSCKCDLPCLFKLFLFFYFFSQIPVTCVVFFPFYHLVASVPARLEVGSPSGITPFLRPRVFSLFPLSASLVVSSFIRYFGPPASRPRPSPMRLSLRHGSRPLPSWLPPDFRTLYHLLAFVTRFRKLPLL